MKANHLKTASESGGHRRGWLALSFVILFLLVPMSIGFLWPRSPVLKTGPRITCVKTLTGLGRELLAWHQAHNDVLPETLGQLGSAYLTQLGPKTNTFCYLGESGLIHDIVAIERPGIKRSLFQHWTDDKLAVLHRDFSVTADPTNRLPAEVLSRLEPQPPGSPSW